MGWARARGRARAAAPTASFIDGFAESRMMVIRARGADSLPGRTRTPAASPGPHGLEGIVTIMLAAAARRALRHAVPSPPTPAGHSGRPSSPSCWYIEIVKTTDGLFRGLGGGYYWFAIIANGRISIF